MLFLKHVPRPPLAEFVAYLWLVSDAPSHSTERILPTGTLELVINLREDRIRIYDERGASQRLSGAILSGAYTRPFAIDTVEHALAMGVHFRPGGAVPFTRRVVPGDLTDHHVNLDELWGSRAAELRERLSCAMTHRERFQILESTLVGQAVGSRKRRAIVPAALQRLQRRKASVREVVASLGSSHRHFASSFREEVGMTPKSFFCIQRFQRALSIVQESEVMDWASLAFECGYYDQAHMIRDFAAFARRTPGECLRRGRESVKDHHMALG